MNDALLTFLSAFLQFVRPMGVLAWAYLQPIYADTPSSLLIGIAIGVLISQLLRGFLMAALFCALTFFAIRMFGVSI